ncbi:MAG: sodium:proton antiporter [Bacteroidetes bacterium]|nr:MAG: sodium:proton antiporter [Bacteroidota bacterium]PIE87947.1 MAG: sodium:proton antiporter [Bacteroidota bacterium]
MRVPHRSMTMRALIPGKGSHGLFLLLLLLFSIRPALSKEIRIAIHATDPTIEATAIHLQKPDVAVEGIPTSFYLQLDKDVAHPISFVIHAGMHDETMVLAPGERRAISFTPQKHNVITLDHPDTALLTFKAIPQWMSILPPLIAIAIALLFKEVFTALFLGIFSGAFVVSLYGGSSLWSSIPHAIQRIIDTYILQSLYDKGHLSIILFSMLIGGMVNLITRNGGMQGVIRFLSRYARSPRSGQFITWLLGIAIFFDDYANTLVVGNTMRPVTDQLRISREKLAYLVDSTAAPIASIAFITTWIGAEISYIQDGITTIGLEETPYNIFFHSLQYAFYPILTLIFILLLIQSNRDFGPMYKAEKRARQGMATPSHGEEEKGFSNNLNDLTPEQGVKAHAYNAVIPVVTVIVGTITGLFITGLENNPWEPQLGIAHNLSNVIGASDSYKALLWASLGSVLVTVLLTVGGRILPMRKAVDSLINGFRTMLTAIIILIMAWSIALLTKEMHTADFISRIALAARIPAELIPGLTFVLAALVSFSTGTSWGTMAILYPLVLPASWFITQETGMDYEQALMIFYIVVSTVLTGSVLGDHCSPISDTTILSSLASSCDHIQHVRTQMPYAVTAGSIALFMGIIPAAYGIPVWILFILSISTLFLLIRIMGKKHKPLH